MSSTFFDVRRRQGQGEPDGLSEVIIIGVEVKKQKTRGAHAEATKADKESERHKEVTAVNARDDTTADNKLCHLRGIRPRR